MAVYTQRKEIEDFASAHALHLALGYFDGVHLGHQALLEKVLQLSEERGGEPGVLLLEPHPQRVLGGNEGLGSLNTLEEKIRIIRRFGDIHIFILTFDRDFAALSPEAFARDYLAGLLRARTAVCGYNYRFGHKGGGNSRDLERLGLAYGFACSILPQVTAGGKPVSSTGIRKLIESGDMYEAYFRLGHGHIYEGNVVGGRKLGTRLGFPTANLELDGGLLWPAYGVYGGFIRDGEGRIHRGVVNAGIRPTVNQEGGAPSFEVYLTDYEGDLYGDRLQAALTDRLRPEKAFGSVEELKEQISLDTISAAAALDEWEKKLADTGGSPASIFTCFLRSNQL
ncbi:MAG: riboflavin biosynthesis protein RibF [Clostridiales bacterium]|nr:riboflavin biosynthesis protein RibF [Clostridiales bacterium]